MTEMLQYKKKDFVSDQEVRWCPGCGDYAILSSVQLAMTKIGVKKENIAVISGIGCSSRFPYYMDTFGMHTIHGRAPGFASGLKSHNPDISTWVITGDGDGLSIGGNHLIHAIRRNLDINIILFNNEIYGLTKGQYSPTSHEGIVTKSSPYGSIDRPFVPSQLALGANSTFYARTIDTDPKHMQEMFVAAQKHKGTSFIEILQNCVIFNNAVHDKFTNRANRDDTTVRVEHGKPMIFGKDKNQGIKLNGLSPEVVTIGENGVTQEDIHIHDETDRGQAGMLSHMYGEGLPIALGIFRQVQDNVYEDRMHQQIAEVTAKKGKMSMQDVLYSGDTWTVE